MRPHDHGRVVIRAKERGHEYGASLDSKWSAVAAQVVELGLYLKFNQTPLSNDT